MVVKPSQEELERRRIVGVGVETVSNVTSTDFPGHYPGEDNSWDIEHFKKTCHIKFHSNEQFDAQFSLVGVDASIANAFRRIMIAEVPTLAIEDVYIFNNTSIIQDEVLSHRLGLIPLKGNREGLDWMKWFKKPTEEDPEGSVPTDHNTVVLNLEVECTFKEKGRERAIQGETNPDKLYENHKVYAHHLKFEPTGQQNHYFPPGAPIAPVNPDIIIAKLRPGQEIKCSLHCIKGIGADHAKFSPVATASYRLLPRIDILRPILGRDAHKFARCFPRGVIGLEPVTPEEAAVPGSGYDGHAGEEKAVVRDPMRDTVSREVLRHAEFADKVRLGRYRDHFLFRVESTGQWDSDQIFLESVKILKQKALKMKKGLEGLMR